MTVSLAALERAERLNSRWETWSNNVKEWEASGRINEFPQPPSTPPEDNIDLRNLQLNNIPEGLNGVNFGKANLYNTTFCNSNLRNTNLINTTGLTPSSFIGADLTAAIVSASYSESDIKSIDNASKYASRSLIALVISCIYSLITVGSTTDAILVLNESTFRLPFLGAEVSINHFYFWTPMLILGIYTYLHLYLMRIYSVGGRLPAVLPDGRYIDDAIDPWLFNSLLRILNKRSKSSDMIFDGLTLIVIWSVGWLLAPFSITIIWGKYLTKHDYLLSGYHVIIFTVMLIISIYSLIIAVEKCRLKSHSINLRAVSVVTAASIVVIVLYLTNGPFFTNPNNNANLILAKLKIHPTAYLNESRLSTPPEGWNGENDQYNFIKGANLKGVDLKGAIMNSCFLQKGDLRYSNLSYAYLNYSNMRDSDVRNAVLDYSEFNSVNMINTNMTGSKLRCVNMTNAKLTNANLSNTIFDGSTLKSCDLSGVIVANTSMKSVDLRHSNISLMAEDNIDIRGSDLRGTSINLFAVNGANINPDSFYEQLLYTIIDSTTMFEERLIAIYRINSARRRELLRYTEERIEKIMEIRQETIKNIEEDGGTPRKHLLNTRWKETIVQ
ncbi:pentapeptide repeat-containing protein [bacterium]|nr:pentapeptide repeat-containing protein [bacterium]